MTEYDPALRRGFCAACGRLFPVPGEMSLR